MVESKGKLTEVYIYIYIYIQCIFGDLLILILPIQPLWRMQASFRRRFTLIGVITFGGMSPLVSCLRVIVLHEFQASPDFTWTLGKMVIVSAIELDIAIMASNAASMKAIWVKYFHSNDASDSSGKQSLSSIQKQQSNELVNLPYSSRAKRSGHTRMVSTAGSASQRKKALEGNESEEELFKGTGITVTSSVALTSKDSGGSSTNLNRVYFEFKK